jgi:hypothetical protein
MRQPKLYNLVNKELREDLVSGDALKTTVTVLDVVNPTKLITNALEFKPENEVEEFMSRIPSINIIAGLGRKLKFWKMLFKIILAIHKVLF